ncbi:MAG: hypothetical protein ACERKO_03070 [Acetanaerobacterium sp.]
MDMLECKEATAVFTNNSEVVPAGATLYSMSVKHKNAEYQKYADAYDFRVIFDDDIPQIDFYTVPRVDIFAKDSLGGLFGTIGQTTDIDDGGPICYINKSKACFLIANSLKVFLQMLASECDWRTSMLPNNDIVFYKSKLDAEHSLEFLKTHQEIKNSDC